MKNEVEELKKKKRQWLAVISSSTCKELRSPHSVLTSKKKKKAEQTGKSATVPRSIREDTGQTAKIEEIGKNKESQLMGAEI